MISAREYGAQGDGQTDDTLAISLAMDSAHAIGARLHFSAGAYVCGPIAKDYGLRITGDGPTETTIVQAPAAIHAAPIWSFAGVIGDMLLLASDARAGSYTITLAGIHVAVAKGDLIIISSVRLVDAMNAGNEYIGQQLRVRRVVFGEDRTILTTYEPLTDDFTVGDWAEVRVVNPIQCSVQDLSFDNPQPGQTRAVGLQIAYAENVTIARVAASRMDNPALVLRDVYGFQVSSCTWMNFNNDPKADRHPYGVVVQCASAHGMVSNCRADRVRHLFTTDGAANMAGCPYHILVTDCMDSNSLNAAFDTHPAARNITFVNCSSYGSHGAGLQARGRGVAFMDCTVVGARYGAVLMLASQDCEIRDCRFFDIAAPPEPMDSGVTDGGVGILVNHPARGLKIIGNVFKNLARSVVRFASTSTGSSDVVIRDNLVENPARADIPGDRDFVRGVRAPVVAGLLVERNRIVQTDAGPAMRYLVATLGPESSVLAVQNTVPSAADPNGVDSTMLSSPTVQLAATQFGM